MLALLKNILLLTVFLAAIAATGGTGHASILLPTDDLGQLSMAVDTACGFAATSSDETSSGDPTSAAPQDVPNRIEAAETPFAGPVSGAGGAASGGGGSSNSNIAGDFLVLAATPENAHMAGWLLGEFACAIPEPTAFVVWTLLGLTLTGGTWWRVDDVKTKPRRFV